jgi:26S proteasome regulatory subunit N1
MQLKERLEILYERLRDPEEAQRLHALSEIKKDVSGATSSMTSVPKPLKFLSKHYAGLKDIYHALPASDFKVRYNSLNPEVSQ